jgi:hypothetical protein
MKALASLWVAAFALVACDSQPQERRAAPAEETVTSLASIAGPWAIVRFGDFEPSWRTNVGWRAAYVHVREDGLSYSIGCNHSGNGARLDQEGVLHTHGDYPSTLMGCPADSKVSDRAFFGFFRMKPRVTRVDDERIRIAGNGAELVLERPERRRLALAPRLDEIQGRWVPVFLDNLSGEGMSGFSMEEPRGLVVIAGEEIEWSGCPEATVGITYSGSFHLVKRSDPRGDCGLSEQQGKDGATRLMRVMRSSPAVERSGEDRIVIFAGDEAAHLQRE